ncbi:MAG: ABC transporter ATP-binding protein [Lysobacteraceae bacterium]
MSAPTSDDYLLEVDGLAKAYPKGSDGRARLRAMAAILFGRPYAMHDCIRDVSFRVAPGQSLGIIGENGAGKSTLLKLVCSVLQPTAGRVLRRGKVGALLELGAGFDMERSGRENIALSAGLMGWDAAQIRARSPDIIAFADIGDYIDEPVKHYSSGMVVRLGFAVIAAVRPDLLITDEVLAVGDESFQKKCIRWMEDYLDSGGTLLLVSHSMYHVQKLCKHALWLKDGRVEAYGDVFDVTQDYLAFHERKSAAQIGDDLDAAYSGGEYRIVRVWLDGEEDATPRAKRSGDGLSVEVELYSPDDKLPQLGIGILRADGTAVYGTTTEIAAATPTRVDARHIRYAVRFDAMPLLPGGYAIKLHALDPEGIRLFDTVERGMIVRGQSREFGIAHLAHQWQ